MKEISTRHASTQVKPHFIARTDDYIRPIGALIEIAHVNNAVPEVSAGRENGLAESLDHALDHLALPTVLQMPHVTAEDARVLQVPGQESATRAAS